MGSRLLSRLPAPRRAAPPVRPPRLPPCAPASPVVCSLGLRARCLPFSLPHRPPSCCGFLPPMGIDGSSHGQAPSRASLPPAPCPCPAASPSAGELGGAWPAVVTAQLLTCIRTHVTVAFASAHVRTRTVIHPSLAPWSLVRTRLYVLLPRAFVRLCTFTSTYRYPIFSFCPFYTFV